MIEDIKILEAVERYISGLMTPDERVYFEQLRKSNPEVDQMVVEHTFFLQQMNRFDETRKLKHTLADTHIHLAEKGLIKSPKLKGKAKVIYLYNRYKKVSAIAASIAGITALGIIALVLGILSVNPNKPASKSDVIYLKGNIEQIAHEVGEIKKNNQKLTEQINEATTNESATPPIQYKSGGTGFLVDNLGYIITSEHIIGQSRNVAVQTAGGRDLRAIVVFRDAQRDIAILKITDKNYKAPGTVPFILKRSGASIAEPIFTLGYPRNEIVYGQGYLSAKTGFHGDTLSCQITIPSNPGNSGSPILNTNGEVIGLLTGKQANTEGAVFAIHSKYIINALNELQKDSLHKNVKLPSSSLLKGSARQKQVERIADFVYMVKVD